MERNKQIRKLFALASKLGINVREVVAELYPQKLLTSLKEFSDEELNSLEKWFIQASAKPNEAEKMRKKIFSLCYQMGYAFNGDGEDMKMNQARVYGLVERIGYLKPKPLMQYSTRELPKLVSQFEKMLTNNEYQQSREVVRNALAEMNEAEQKEGFKSYLN